MKRGVMKNYFSAWTGLDLSKDDTDKTDEKLGFVKGVVSSEIEDQAGDIIKQDGLDWSYFLDKGYFNWEHQSGPENILGYPTKIVKGDSDTSVEGYLFLDRPKAKDAYDMAKILKDVQAPRSIGFSIEGQVMERDKENDHIITKAKILNVSITAHPCNPDAKLMVKAIAEMENYMKKKATIEPTLLKATEEEQKKAQAEAEMAQTEDEKKNYSSDDEANKSTTEDTVKNDDTSTKADDQGSKKDDQEAQKVEDDQAEKAQISKSEDDEDDEDGIAKAEGEDDEEDEDDSLEDDSLDDSSLSDDFWDDADRKYVDEAFGALWAMLNSLQDQLTAQIKSKRVAQRQALAQKSVEDITPVSSKDLLERIAKHFPTMTEDQQKQLTRKSADIIRKYFVKD